MHFISYIPNPVDRHDAHSFLGDVGTRKTTSADSENIPLVEWIYISAISNLNQDPFS